MAAPEYDIQLRRDTSTNWTTADPILKSGELGYETNSGRFKVGNGVATWSSLPYQILTLADVGVSVASLVAGKVPAEQIGQVATATTTSFTPAGDLVATNVQAAIQELDTEKVTAAEVKSAGVVVKPTYVNNGDGSITVGSGQYSLYNNAAFTGTPKTYTIAGGTYTLTDNSPNYLLAKYNSGTPVLEMLTSVPDPSTTDSDRTPIFSMYRTGTDIHQFDWDTLANGLAEKLNQRMRRTDRFHIDNGLVLSESATRVINIASGAVWAGANLIPLNAITSAGETHFYYHSGGNWVKSSITDYNNTQYDNGTSLQTLSNNRYAVNWIYRSVQQVGAIYTLLGGGDYSLIQAQSSSEPTKPEEIATQAVLVGRIIVLKSATTATEIDKVSSVSFGVAEVSQHNDLSSKQGGTTDEFYHLTSAEYTGSGTGVFLRQTTPIISGGIGMVGTANEYGWRDLIGDITPKTSGAGAPTLDTITGNIRGFRYSSGDDGDAVYHIPHDYAPGTDLYLHPHWLHNGTNISGSLVITIYATYAKGHQQANFQTQITTTITDGSLNITNTPTLRHRIPEIQLSTPGGSASMLNTSDIEVDGLILLHYDVTTIPTITGGSGEPFLLTFDLHYKSTGINTKNKAPNFYA